MNAGAGIRIGTVSTVDYENGMVSVKYEDMNNAVTAEMPYFSFGGEYKMPRIDETVIVLYLSNGSSIGIVIGSFWNKSNKPPVSGKNTFYKDIAQECNISYQNGTLTINAPQIKLVTDEGETTI